MRTDEEMGRYGDANSFIFISFRLELVSAAKKHTNIKLQLFFFCKNVYSFYCEQNETHNYTSVDDLQRN
jgi:hypothetical protein